jgi:hypothetical protein
LARAPLIAFCDDDDQWIREDHLEIALRAFEEDPDLDYYFASQEAYRGNVVDKEDWLPNLTARVWSDATTAQSIYRVSARQLMEAGHFPHLNVTVVRRRLLDEVSGFSNFLPYSEDLDISRRFAASARGIGYRPSVVARHNVPPATERSNASTQFDMTEKRLILSLVHCHVALKSGDEVVGGAAIRDLGNELRHLTEFARERGGRKATRAFARMALMAKPGWKWALYTLLLHLGYERRS